MIQTPPRRFEHVRAPSIHAAIGDAIRAALGRPATDLPEPIRRLLAVLGRGGADARPQHRD